MAEGASKVHEIVVRKAFDLILQQPEDIVLQCDDGRVKTHKLILSAASSYFEVNHQKNLFTATLIWFFQNFFKENDTSAVLIPGVNFADLLALVRFITSGVLRADQLQQSFLNFAKMLKISIPLEASTVNIPSNQAALINTKPSVTWCLTVQSPNKKMRSKSIDMPLRGVLKTSKISAETESQETSEVITVKDEVITDDLENVKAISDNECKFCNKFFIHRINRDKHIQRCYKNPSAPMFSCTICQKASYSRKQHLNRHMITKHRQYTEIL